MADFSFFSSSQDFVRALKAPADPPQNGGPTKIDIALKVWNDHSFYVPNKDEIIGDWLLTKFHKGKEQDVSIGNSIHWSLLLEVLSINHANTHSKAWLVSALSRVSIVPIAIRFLRILPRVYSNNLHNLAKPALACFKILWSLGAAKAPTECLLDCFGSALEICANVEHDDSLHSFTSMVASYYRDHLSKLTSKKKSSQIHGFFLNNSLLHWLRCIGPHLPPSLSRVSGQWQEQIYSAGIETLFSVDVLRQTQNTEAGVFEPLMDALSALSTSNSRVVAETSHRILLSAIGALKRHRGVISGPSTGGPKSTVNSHALQMLGRYLQLLDVVEKPLGRLEAWKARESLLSTVQEEALVGHTDASKHTRDAKALLTLIAQRCAPVLAETSDTQTAACILRVVAILSHIERDMVQQSVPLIMRSLLTIPECSEGVNLLGQFLDYATQSRSLTEHILLLIGAMTAGEDINLNEAASLYRQASESSLLSEAHMSSVASAVRTFVTPGQVSPIVQAAVGTLGERLNTVLKSVKHFNKETTHKGLDSAAVSFSLAAKVFAVVVPALPLYSLDDEGAREVEVLVRGIQTEYLERPLSKLIKVCKESEESFAVEVAAAATLRFCFSLSTISTCSTAPLQEDMIKILLNCVSHYHVGHRELELEIFRSLLAQSSTGISLSPNEVLDPLFTSLQGCMKAQSVSSSSRWAGRASHLARSPQTTAEDVDPAYPVALAHLLTTRYIMLLSYASVDNIRVLLLALMAYADEETSYEYTYATNHVDWTLIAVGIWNTAEFWEITHIRDVLTAVLDEETKAVNSVIEHADSFLDVRQWSRWISEADIRRASAVYPRLLSFPSEYFGKPFRGDLVQRAVFLDGIWRQVKDTTHNEREIAGLRSVILRNQECLDAIRPQDLCAYAEFMVTETCSLPLDDPWTAKSTAINMDVFTAIVSFLLQRAKQSKKSPYVENIIARVASRLSSISEGSSSRVAIEQVMISMADAILQKHSCAEMPEGVLKQLHDLFQTATRLFSVILTEPIEKLCLQPDLSGILSCWAHILAFQSWLGNEDTLHAVRNPLPSLGIKLIPAILSMHKPCSTSLCCAACSLTSEELSLRNKAIDRAQLLDSLIASYFAFCTCVHVNDAVAPPVRKHLTPEDYSYVANALSGLLTDPKRSPNDLIAVIDTATIFLRDAPEGTTKITQSFLNSALQIFSDHNAFFGHTSDLPSKACNFASRQMQDRPAILRLQDMDGICIFFSNLLACSSVPRVERTRYSIFHTIVNCLNNLVRLRRDLAVTTLPHIGLLVRSLILLMRRTRTQLGPKQKQMIVDTFPHWINASSSPLGVEEARALARLLTTFTAKTTVRTFGQQTGLPQKSESLAKPFSKHAAYVLTAYLKAVNEPLCAVPNEIRHELQPGLFALCEMTSEDTRDAVMISSLDAGEKATFKALWKDYEKQRYVGRG